mgnify:FL=1
MRQQQSVWYRHLNRSGQHKNGHDRYYFRPKQFRGALPAAWKMPAVPLRSSTFLQGYAEALTLWNQMQQDPTCTGRTGVAPGSLAEAAAGYKASHGFSLLAPATRSVRRKRLEGMIDLYGAAQVAGLQQQHVNKDLSRFDGHAQRNHLKMWRHFAKFLMSEYGIADPTDGVARAKVAQSDGHEPWSMDDVQHFRKMYPLARSERLCLELLYWTGARIGDAVRLGRGHVTKDGWLSFYQGKTGGLVDVPFSRQLPSFALADADDLQMLHAAIDAQPVKHMTFLCTARGASRSEKAVSNWFAGKARDVGLDRRTAHGLRKSRAIRWAELGATSVQIGAWTGHESLKEIERYIKKYSRRAALTGGAITQTK